MVPNMCDPHTHAMNVGLVEEALEAGRLRDCEDLLDYMDAAEGGWKMACAKRLEADLENLSNRLRTLYEMLSGDHHVGAHVALEARHDVSQAQARAEILREVMGR